MIIVAGALMTGAYSQSVGQSRPKPEGHCHGGASVTSNALERQMHLSQKTTRVSCRAPAMRLQIFYYNTHANWRGMWSNSSEARSL